MLWGRGNEKGSKGEAKTAYYGSQGRSPTLTIIVRMGEAQHVTITQQI